MYNSSHYRCNMVRDHLRYKILAQIVLIITLCVISIFATTSAQSDNISKFRVGVVLPLTGPLSFQGIALKNALLLGKEHFDKNNIIDFYFEDDQFIPKNSLLAAEKLITTNRVNALMVFGTNQGRSVVSTTERKKIPLISLNVNKVVVKDASHAVIYYPNLEDLTALNIKEAQRRGYSTVAILASQQDSCLEQRRIFESSHHFSIVASEEVPLATTSIKELLPKILKKNPDAIFLSTIPPHGSLFAKELRASGYKGELFGGIQLSFLAELHASQGALERAWTVGGDDSNATSFSSSYQSTFKELPTAEAVYGYDAVNLLVKGVASGDLTTYLHTASNIATSVGVVSADGKNGFSIPIRVKIFGASSYNDLLKTK